MQMMIVMGFLNESLAKLYLHECLLLYKGIHVACPDINGEVMN